MSDRKSEQSDETKVQIDSGTEHEGDAPPPTGCGILGRYPVLSVMLFAATGVSMGVGLSYWDPEDDSKDLTLKWFGLIGDLFIRALKCVVLPLVFINVVLSVVDMCTVGKAGSIGWKTIATYLFTTLAAATIGIISVAIFRPLFNSDDFQDSGPAEITLGCDTDGSYLAEFPDGSVSCTSDLEGNRADSTFYINDISGTFVKKSSGAANDISLSDTIYDGVFTKLVTSNIFGAFSDANFAAVVFFAIFFGIALCRVYDRRGVSYEAGFVMTLFKELDGVLITMINWIIMVTPFAVWSLIVKAIGQQDDLAQAFENVGYLVITTIVAMIAQYIIVYNGLIYFVTKQNPFEYLRNYIPAQTMAFACASSAATIPVTLRCAKGTGKIPDPVARFVIPLGATVNMDGGAIYFPCSCVWLAVLNGLDPNVGNYILLIIIATIGSIGTAPVPSASLVLIITAYNTVFGTTGTPDGFSYIFAIDWFMDRLRTTLNVTGDGVVAGIVSHLCPMNESSSFSNATASGKKENSSSASMSEEHDVVSGGAIEEVVAA